MSDTETLSRIPHAAPAAAIDRARALPRENAKPATLLSPEALEVAARPSAAPISPIVLAGFVRMGEFALITVVGLGIYAAYLSSYPGLIWQYTAAILSIA